MLGVGDRASMARRKHPLEPIPFAPELVTPKRITIRPSRPEVQEKRDRDIALGKSAAAARKLAKISRRADSAARPNAQERDALRWWKSMPPEDRDELGRHFRHVAPDIAPAKRALLIRERVAEDGKRCPDPTFQAVI